MSHDLGTPLRDLVRDVPDHLDSAQLARTAWTAGRRRRIRRRWLAGAACLAALTVLSVAITSVLRAGQVAQPAGGASGPRVGGYPERILHQWWIRDLPTTPGPVAGLVDGSDSRWKVVSATGHLWRLPAPPTPGDEYPTLSPNGRYLGYLTGARGSFVIHDLVTGHVITYRSVGSGSGTPSYHDPRPLYVVGQTPGFWSPDNTRLLMWGGLWSDRRGDRGKTLLLDLHGHARLLPVPTKWNPAGWASPHRLVWTHGPTRHVPGGRLTDVEVTNLAGTPVRSFSLRVPLPVGATSQSQWSWTTSPNGSQLLFTAEPDPPEEAGYAIRYSLANGSKISTSRVTDLWQPCGGGWAGDTPVAPAILADGNAAATVQATRQPSRLSVTDPQLKSYCILWAADALAGVRHGGLFGTATAAWTWWWREALILTTAIGLTVAGIRARRRRAVRGTANTDLPT
jgi:hypothetical protein